MLHVGHENYVDRDKIAAIANTEKHTPAPVKRAIESAEERGQLINLAAGRRVRSVLFLNSGQVVLSGISGTALKNRAIDTTA